MRNWDQKTINAGDTVYGSDNKEVGSVEYCEDDFLKIDMGSPDLCYYVPCSAIEDVRPGEVFLNVPSDQIGRMGWECPPQPATGAPRRKVITAEETEGLGQVAEEQIGETEPM